MSTHRDLLSLSRTQFWQTYLTPENQPYDKVVISAIILDSLKVLLVKHAAHEVHFPNVFEFPGGKVDNSDATLGAVVEREMMEETGLKVKNIIRESLPRFAYETEKAVEGVKVVKSSLQVNFVVKVEKGQITLNPEEHCEYMWDGVEDLESLEMTDGMRSLVSRFFSDNKQLEA
jgi:8-oxo-dGTP pyrophosphatase MutT (NUDIX family)